MRVGALLGVVIICLTGCDVGVSRGVPIAIQTAGESIRIAVCFDTAPIGLRVDERGPGDQGEWSTIWNVAGEARIESGQILNESSIPATFGSTEELDPYSPAENMKVLVVLTNPPGEGNALAEFDANRLDDSKWLQTDGTTTAAPCVPETP
jgi:hypothetical protein